MSIPTTLSRPHKNIILSRVLQLLSGFFGLSFFAWAFLDARFLDAEGFLSGSVGLPLSLGIALLIVGSTITGRLRRFALWLALAIGGQAVALQLIQAGPSMRYQHYLPFDHLLTETHPLLLVYLAAQVILVVIGLSTRWSKLCSWVGQNFKLWQIVGVTLVFFLTSATVSPQVSVYLAELLFAALVQTINLGNIILVAWALPEENLAVMKGRLDRLFGTVVASEESSEPGGLDRFALLVAVWVFVLAALFSYFSYERHPHIPDEVAYLYHAHFLAAGKLTMPLPPVPQTFEVYLMYFREHVWYPSPPPGWPAVLAIGVLFGVPWLVNPILAGLNVLMTYLLLREFYSRRTARLALLLLGISPWYLFLGMSFMTHIFTLTCGLLAAVGVAWARRTGWVGWAWVGGLGLGMLAIIRPLEAFVVAGLLGLWAIGLGGRRLKLSALIGLGLATTLSGAVVLPYNWALTGNPAKFPIMAYTDEHFGPNANAMGFGPDRGMNWPIDPYPGHSPLDALINANLNTFSINIELFGWSIGSLLPISLIILAGRLRRSDYLMLTLIAGIFIAHLFYYFSGGPDFGARYWFLMIIPCMALAARGIQYLGQKLEAGSLSSPQGHTRLLAVVLCLCLLTGVNYLPWRAIDKYHHYLNMRPDVRTLAQVYGFGKSLVFIRGAEHPDYASATAYNPVDVYADGPVYVRDCAPEVGARLLAAYPDWPVWIVNGPTMTHAGYQVVAGPLSAEEFLASASTK
jgi:hypothetical protein